MRVRHLICGAPLALLLAFTAIFALTTPAAAQVTVSVAIAPPELPVYDQPPIPADGYIWTPGYWAWSDDDQDYYWVPGTWVEAPQVGYLWTPGYWGTDGGTYLWNAGYWGPQIGFYGGVYYGYGYFGHGYEGGYWQGNHLYYNTAVSNIGTVHITNVYNKTVINNTVNRTSYNGGGGIRAQPSASELQAAQSHHISALPAQRQQEQAARGNESLRASVNHGSPPIAATSRPGVFSGGGVVAAHHTGTMSVVGAQPRSAPAPRTEVEQRSAVQRPEAAAPRPQAPAPRPEARQPEARSPEVRQPEVRQPEARQPETRAPENVQPREAPRVEPRPAATPAPRPEPRPAPRQPERPPEHPPEH